MLTKDRNVLIKARKNGYAIPAFNFENMEMAKAVISECEKLSSPVILQTTPSTLNYISPVIAKEVVSFYSKDINIPVILHLDHSNSFELCEECIRVGYTSVMIDGSKLPFEENIKLSNEVIKMAVDIPVECELGRIGGKEETEEKNPNLTSVKEAVEFVKRTECSSLAVAIGTAHGFYKSTPKLDFERLKELEKNIKIPLVLHGTSGVDTNDVKKAIENGISKVNYATELRASFSKGVRLSLEDKDVYDPKVYLNMGMESLKETIRERVYTCGSENKA